MASGAQACFLTVKSTATPPRTLRNTLACFLAGEGTPLPPYKGVFLRIIIIFYNKGIGFLRKNHNFAKFGDKEIQINN